MEDTDDIDLELTQSDTDPPKHDDNTTYTTPPKHDDNTIHTSDKNVKVDLGTIHNYTTSSSEESDETLHVYAPETDAFHYGMRNGTSFISTSTVNKSLVSLKQTTKVDENQTSDTRVTSRRSKADSSLRKNMDYSKLTANETLRQEETDEKTRGIQIQVEVHRAQSSTSKENAIEYATKQPEELPLDTKDKTNEHVPITRNLRGKRRRVNELSFSKTEGTT